MLAHTPGLRTTSEGTFGWGTGKRGTHSSGHSMVAVGTQKGSYLATLPRVSCLCTPGTVLLKSL